jgi:hypothetical protein
MEETSYFIVLIYHKSEVRQPFFQNVLEKIYNLPGTFRKERVKAAAFVF